MPDGSGVEPSIACLTVLLDGEEIVVQVGAGQTLLRAAEAAGLRLPARCRQGVCGTCIAALKSGDVTMMEGKGLSKRERDGGFILVCRSMAASATLTISYD